MYYGLYIPNFGDETSVRALATLAQEAEEAGWDGFFLWDHIVYRAVPPVTMVDPWIALSAIAMTTQRIRIGTTVTPLARRHPWKLARETVSLDHLSQGRLILGVGLGDPPKTEFALFGEEPDNRVRAAKLDEGLAILTGLWSGKPFRYQGTHYQVQKIAFWPPALQTPRIPIWVAGFWPNKAPFRRAARWDGVVPLKQDGLQPADIEQIAAYIKAHRSSEAPFDIIKIGISPGDNRAKGSKMVAPFAAAGATWWLESLFTRRNSFEQMRQRIRQGPPRSKDPRQWAKKSLPIP
jgi:alkanesulfonate monooxygenase SsuD/methylene tetrahydromethanopterin reductase-like flavin-dependent oxidoreductase (luciferase family)